MQMQCTVTPNDRQFNVALTHKEASLLSRMMNMIDLDMLARQTVINESDFNDHVTGEMTESEIRDLIDAHNANLIEAMQDYGNMVLLVEQLKRLAKM